MNDERRAVLTRHGLRFTAYGFCVSPCRDEGSQLAEAAFADAADEEEVFDAAEGAVAFAVLDDARGERGADAGQSLKLLARGEIDRDGRRRFVEVGWRRRGFGPMR